MFVHIRLKTIVSLLCAGVLVALTALTLPGALRGRADAPGQEKPRMTATMTGFLPCG